MEATLKEAMQLASDSLKLASKASSDNNGINKALVTTLIIITLITNLAWGTAYILRDYYYFTTDYDYYGETVNTNENVNNNINESKE